MDGVGRNRWEEPEVWMWGVERILRYLDEFDITIAIVNGSPVLRASDRVRTAAASTGEGGQREWKAAIDRVMPHLKYRKAELLTELQKFADPDDSKPLSPHQRRQKRLAQLRETGERLTRIPGCESMAWAVCWYSGYTLAVGTIQSDRDRYPAHASMTYLVVRRPPLVKRWEEGGPVFREDVSGGLVWRQFGKAYDLPGSTPPRGWREPPNFEFPVDWKPPPGFTFRKKAKVKRPNPWKTEATFRDSMPPD